MKRRHVLGLGSGIAAGLLVSGCAGTGTLPADARRATLPPLRLSPSSLGAARYALSQRLTVSRLDRSEAPVQQVDLQLQLDASGLLVAGFALGQRVLLMRWDGSELQVQRHPRLPAEVDTDRMLRDLCLVFWPSQAVRDALPPGWSWTDEADGQQLRQAGEAWLTVRRHGDADVEILNLAEGYRLRVESQPLEGM